MTVKFIMSSENVTLVKHMPPLRQNTAILMVNLRRYTCITICFLSHRRIVAYVTINCMCFLLHLCSSSFNNAVKVDSKEGPTMAFHVEVTLHSLEGATGISR